MFPVFMLYPFINLANMNCIKLNNVFNVRSMNLFIAEGWNMVFFSILEIYQNILSLYLWSLQTFSRTWTQPSLYSRIQPSLFSWIQFSLYPRSPPIFPFRIQPPLFSWIQLPLFFQIQPSYILLFKPFSIRQNSTLSRIPILTFSYLHKPTFSLLSNLL